MARRRLTGMVVATMVAALAVGCHGESDPEQEIRARIAAAEAAAEARDTGFFRDLLADSFVDHQGRDRHAVVSLLRLQFLANRRIEVVSRIHSITVTGGDAAQTVLSAGLLGSRGPTMRPGQLRGDLYRLELEWIKEGREWRIIGARWSRLRER